MKNHRFYPPSYLFPKLIHMFKQKKGNFSLVFLRIGKSMIYKASFVFILSVFFPPLGYYTHVICIQNEIEARHFLL